MTFWFLSFLGKKPGDEHWHPENATTCSEHPIDYIRRARETYSGYSYRLLYFYEIPEDVYRRANPRDDDAPGAVPQDVR